MKIGDKLKKVLAENPEIQQRRAQIAAIGYLFKHHKNAELDWNTVHTDHTTDTRLLLTIKYHGNRWKESITNIIHMKSLSEYKPKEVKLKDPNNPTLVFKSGQFKVVP